MRLAISHRERCPAITIGMTVGITLRRFWGLKCWARPKPTLFRGERRAGAIAIDQPYRRPKRIRVIGSCEPFRVKQVDVAAGRQPAQAHHSTCDKKPGQRLEQAGDSAPARWIAGHSQVGSIAQDRANQRGQGRAGTDLDENPRSVVMHGLHHLGEPDRLG
jgi:hypothetical protein